MESMTRTMTAIFCLEFTPYSRLPLPLRSGSLLHDQASDKDQYGHPSNVFKVFLNHAGSYSNVNMMTRAPGILLNSIILCHSKYFPYNIYVHQPELPLTQYQFFSPNPHRNFYHDRHNLASITLPSHFQLLAHGKVIFLARNPETTPTGNEDRVAT